MGNETLPVIALAIVVLLVLLAMGMYVYVVFGIVGIITLLLASPQTIPGINSTMWIMGVNFGFISILLFVLMGNILASTPVGRRLYVMAYAMFGRRAGGLAISTTVANAFFGAMCGSAYAATATFGGFAFREMKERNYDTGFASGSIVGAGTLSPLIPPSIALIIFGTLTETSIGRLFLAGIVPGIILAISFIIYQVIATLRNPALGPGIEHVMPAKEKALAFAGALPPIALIVVVIGSLYTGVASPSEVGALGAVGAIVLAIAYSRGVDLKQLAGAFMNSVRTASFIVVMMLTGKILALAFAAVGLPQLIASLVEGLPAYAVLPVFFLILFAMGFVIDGGAILVLAAPIMFPVVLSLGYDPIAFGIIFVICVQIGCYTPPVCVSCYILQGIIKEPLFLIVRGSIPYACMSIAL